MIYFTAHTINCMCPSIRAMFRVLGVYNFACGVEYYPTTDLSVFKNSCGNLSAYLPFSCRLCDTEHKIQRFQKLLLLLRI